MAEVSIQQLGKEYADDLLDIMRLTWQESYVDAGLMRAETLDEELPHSAQRLAQQERALDRQYLPGDETDPRYFGAFDEGHLLIGFIKTAKPLADLNRYGGRESFLQKVSRKVLKQKPELVDPSLSEIMEVHVRPAYQRRGIGTALVNYAINPANRPSDVSRMRLFTRTQLHPFFAKFGFKPNGERSFYPHPEEGSGIALYGMAASLSELRRA